MTGSVTPIVHDYAAIAAALREIEKAKFPPIEPIPIGDAFLIGIDPAAVRTSIFRAPQPATCLVCLDAGWLPTYSPTFSVAYIVCPNCQNPKGLPSP